MVEKTAVDTGVDEAVSVVSVSPKMNSPRYNAPDCIDAVETPA
jgi:hypothetical protein